MNCLSLDRRVRVIGTLVEGASVNATYRMNRSSEKYRSSVRLCCTPRFECPKPASTSPAMRRNMGVRMGMRRFTRLTNGFSKGLESHGHMVAQYFFHYNFIHKTLRVTPAMEAGITDHVWSFEELLALLETEPR